MSTLLLAVTECPIDFLAASRRGSTVGISLLVTLPSLPTLDTSPSVGRIEFFLTGFSVDSRFETRSSAFAQHHLYLPHVILESMSSAEHAVLHSHL